MESTVWTCPQSPADLLAWVHGQMMNTSNVTSVTRPVADTLEVRASVRPGWTIMCAILLFPIGLLALLKTEERSLLFRAVPNPSGGTLLHIDGATVPSTQKSLIAMWRALFPAEKESSEPPPTVGP